MFPAEDFSDNEELFAKDITKWSSNDLMDKIETIEVDEAQGRLGFCHLLNHMFWLMFKVKRYITSCCLTESRTV